MNSPSLSSMPLDLLVARFTELALAEDQAILDDNHVKYNRLYNSMLNVVAELKVRPGDGRRELVGLYDHQNAQVSLQAAVHTLALEPRRSRLVLERLYEAKVLPYALDAGMFIRGLDDGTFEPA